MQDTARHQEDTVNTAHNTTADGYNFDRALGFGHEYTELGWFPLRDIRAENWFGPEAAQAAIADRFRKAGA